ncbi:MAG: zinc-ribbon domain-containing protein [Armatimonadota bacterium]|nr:zinc-ribbon domain-containing protein [Armatimonadota bacterium]
MSESPLTRLCSYCGERIRMDSERCPYCGTDFVTGEQPPVDKDSVAAASGGFLGCGLTLFVYLYFGAGWFMSREMISVFWSKPHFNRANWMFAATHGIWIGFTLPIAFTGLLYLMLRRRFPVFARGLGYSCLVALAMTLGAPFICR